MPIVRDATAGDVEEVAVIHVRAWQAAYRGLLPRERLAALSPTDRSRRYTFEDRSPFAPRTIVLVQDGAIRGFATYRRSRDRREQGIGELQALYVDPPHWRHGTGRALMQEVYRRLNTEGVVEAVLWVLVGDVRAERFYRADGWLPDGTTRQERFWDVPVPVARFRRPIADLAAGVAAAGAADG